MMKKQYKLLLLSATVLVAVALIVGAIYAVAILSEQNTRPRLSKMPVEDQLQFLIQSGIDVESGSIQSYLSMIKAVEENPNAFPAYSNPATIDLFYQIRRVVNEYYEQPYDRKDEAQFYAWYRG